MKSLTLLIAVFFLMGIVGCQPAQPVIIQAPVQHRTIVRPAPVQVVPQIQVVPVTPVYPVYPRPGISLEFYKSNRHSSFGIGIH